MKLLFCPLCHDVVKLDFDRRFCQCGKSSGAYCNDGLKAWVDGLAMVIGIHNTVFAEVVRLVNSSPFMTKEEALTKTNIRAWVFHPKHAPNIDYAPDKEDKR